MDERATSPIDVVTASIAALNRGDVETALSYCADDIVLWAPGRDLDGQEIVGKERLRMVLEHTEAHWPDIWTSIETIIADGERVAVEMTTVATERGERIAQRMSAFYTVIDGLIVEQRSYYDLGALRRALGG